MAIAFDNATNAGAGSTSSTLTWSHTCTGSNLILFVSCFSAANNSDDITGATYNSVSMTLINKVQNPGSERFEYLFYLVGPATGAHDVVVSSSTTGLMSGAAASYTGAAQSSQPDAQGTATASANIISKTLTSVADNCWAIGWFRPSNIDITADAGTTTSRTNYSPYSFFLGDSNGPKTPAGNITLGASVNGGSVQNLALCMATFSPLASPSTTSTIPNNLLTLGVT